MANLCLYSYDDLYLINLDKVVYFLSDDHYTHVYYVGGISFLVPFGLSKIEEKLIECPSEGVDFVRLGRKHIVCLQRVFHINVSKQQLFITDDSGTLKILKISKPVLRDLKEKLCTNTFSK